MTRLPMPNLDMLATSPGHYGLLKALRTHEATCLYCRHELFCTDRYRIALPFVLGRMNMAYTEGEVIVRPTTRARLRRWFVAGFFRIRR